MSYKAAFGVSLTVLILSVALAITFRIVQGAHYGCWSGDETTNFYVDDDYVLCCNDVDLNTCAQNAVTCVLNHTG